MSIGITIIALMSVINAFLLGAVLFMFIKETRRPRENIMGDQKDIILSLNNLTNGLKKLMRSPSEPAIINMPHSYAHQSDAPKIDTKEVVFARLMEGATPEQIAKELGYSRSEIGIIIASGKSAQKANAAI